MTPHQFIAKWQAADLSERAAYQQHFLDLCELLDHPKPADVWLDQKVSWEYKGKHEDLRSAYQQLLKYRESLNNPPLLIVCSMNCFATDWRKRCLQKTWPSTFGFF